MRHELTTRFVVVLTVLLFLMAVVFALAANVEPADLVEPEQAQARSASSAVLLQPQR